MGVDQGGTKGQVPQNLEWGTLMQIVPPPQILSYRYKIERSVAFKIRQNPLPAGALPRTPAEGAHDGPPNPHVGWGGDTSFHTSPRSAPTHIQRSPCVPRIPARSTTTPMRFWNMNVRKLKIFSSGIPATPQTLHSHSADGAALLRCVWSWPLKIS